MSFSPLTADFEILLWGKPTGFPLKSSPSLVIGPFLLQQFCRKVRHISIMSTLIYDLLFYNFFYAKYIKKLDIIKWLKISS